MSSNMMEDDAMTLNECEFLEAGQSEFFENRIYVCEEMRGLAPERVPDGINFVFVDSGACHPTAAMKKLNYLVISGLDVYKAFNMLLDIFRRYAQIEERFDSMVSGGCTLQKFIDYATEVVEMPLCLLDMNYRVLALSSTIDLQQDKLWDAMKHGYGLPYYDYIKECDIKLEELAKARVREKEAWSNLAGNYLHVSLVLMNGRPIASLGMHKRYEFRKPFEKTTIQLFDYVVKRLAERLALVGDVKECRGKPIEPVLSDVLDGIITEPDKLEEQMRRIGLPKSTELDMGLIFPCGECYRTERFLSYMESIEHIIPNAFCCIYKSRIVFIRFVKSAESEKQKIPEEFQSFLTYNNFACLYSLRLSCLLEIKDAYKMLCDISELVLSRPIKPMLYYACDYLQEYAMTLMYRNCDISKLIHPIVRRTLEYDKKEHSNLYGILRAYLYNDCSLKETSLALYMHRNTLSFKLDRIKAMTDMDFEDLKLRKQVLFSVECYETAKAFALLPKQKSKK